MVGHQFTTTEQQSFARRHGKPTFIGCQRFGTNDRDHIAIRSDLGKINSKIVISQGGGGEGGPPGETMQFSGCIGKQPRPIADQAIKDA